MTVTASLWVASFIITSYSLPCLCLSLNLLCLTLVILLPFCLPLHGLLLTIFNLFFFFFTCVLYLNSTGLDFTVFFFFFFAWEKQGFIITCSQ